MSESESIHAGTRLGPVCLTVRDLEGALAFYQRHLRLRALERDTHTVELTPGTQTAEPILVLRHDPDSIRLIISTPTI